MTHATVEMHHCFGYERLLTRGALCLTQSLILIKLEEHMIRYFEDHHFLGDSLREAISYPRTD